MLLVKEVFSIKICAHLNRNRFLFLCQVYKTGCNLLELQLTNSSLNLFNMTTEQTAERKNKFPEYLEPNCKHRCGSIMIQGHLRFSGLENKLKIKGYLVKNGYNNILSCQAILREYWITGSFNHLILLLFGANAISDLNNTFGVLILLLYLLKWPLPKENQTHQMKRLMPNF